VSTSVSTTTTRTTSTTVSTTEQVVDLTATDAKAIFAEYEAIKKAKSDLEKQEKALKEQLLALTGWTADGVAAVAMVNGEALFKKQAGKTVVWDADMMKLVFPEAFAKCRSEKPNFSIRAA
jgi:hypothetical protein